MEAAIVASHETQNFLGKEFTASRLRFIIIFNGIYGNFAEWVRFPPPSLDLSLFFSFLLTVSLFLAHHFQLINALMAEK